MNLVELNRMLLPAGTVAFFVLALVLPIVRLWRRTGVWGVTALRSDDWLERMVGAVLMLLVLALGVWAGFYAALGPEPLGVWSLPPWTMVVGWCAAAAGLLVTIVAQAQMGASWRIGIDDDKTELVTAGLFRWVRNPIYSGMFLGGAGLMLVTPSPWLLAGSLLGYLGVAYQTRREEEHMKSLHGQQYQSWASRVGRFVPWLGRLPPGEG